MDSIFTAIVNHTISQLIDTILYVQVLTDLRSYKVSLHLTTHQVASDPTQLDVRITFNQLFLINYSTHNLLALIENNYREIVFRFTT